MDGGVLAHVQGRQVEAEAVDGPDQVRQGALGEHLAVLGDQAVLQHLQIGLQLVGARIGRAAEGRHAGRAAGQAGIGRRQPRIDAGERSAIGLVGPVQRGVGGTIGQGLQLRRGLGQAGGDRKLGAQVVDARQVTVQGRARLTGEGVAHDVGGDKGVSVAVAPHPGADAQEARQLSPGHQPAPPGVDLGQFGQEAPLEIGDSVLDLVCDPQLHAAQQPGAPDDGDLPDQFALIARPGGFVRRVVGLQGLHDGVGAVQQALAPHLAGVGGDHRGDHRVGQQVGDLLRTDPGVGQTAHGAGQGVGAALALAPAAALDLVLGDVGDLQEAGEGMGEPHGVGQGEFAQPGFDRVAARLRAVAVQGD